MLNIFATTVLLRSLLNRVLEVIFWLRAWHVRVLKSSRAWRARMFTCSCAWRTCIVVSSHAYVLVCSHAYYYYYHYCYYYYYLFYFQLLRVLVSLRSLHGKKIMHSVSLWQAAFAGSAKLRALFICLWNWFNIRNYS